MRTVTIENPIFELHPHFFRGLIIVSDITNHQSLKRVRKLLKKEIESQAEKDLLADERLLAWDQLHKKFGSNPNKYPPSIKSLMKRIKKNPALPYINTAVALFNYISLKYCLPCGGDDCAAIEGDFVLGLASGSENFLPLGGDTPETPDKGEVIYFDSATRNVMCRRWNWRNGDITKIMDTTRQLIINIDCIPPCSADIAITARDELAALLQQHCGATLQTDCLQSEKRQINIDI